MLLKTNGHNSAGKCSHHLNIDTSMSLTKRPKATLTSDIVQQMIKDYMTEPLHGAKFDNFCQQIMHLPVAAQLMMAAVLN